MKTYVVYLIIKRLHHTDPVGEVIAQVEKN